MISYLMHEFDLLESPIFLLHGVTSECYSTFGSKDVADGFM